MKNINETVYSLNYKPEQVLAFKGNTVGNVEPKTGTLSNGKYIVVNREKRTISGNFDTAVPSSNLDVTYPGATLLANSKLVDGNPQALVAKRGPVTLTLDLPGMGNEATRQIPEGSYELVRGATNDILNDWYARCGGKYQVPANMTYKSDLVYDEKSMQLKFGCTAAFARQSLGIDFDAIAKKSKAVYLVEYKQVFYTASVKPFAHPSDAFDPSVTAEQLGHSGMNNDNPPAYVDNVIYGRQVFVKFETTSNSCELAAMLKAAITVKGVTITPEISAKFGSVMKNTHVSIIALGGTPLDIKNAALSTDTAAINKAILNNVELSAQNPAFPLNYKVVFLKDNKPAILCGNSEYIEETYSEYSNGEIHLRHDGAYVADFNVSWDKITGYDSKGNPVVKREIWSNNDKNVTAGYSTVIALDGNCRNINIRARGKTGLAWEKWRTSLDKKGLALVPKRTIKIWGTTLNQKSSCDPAD